METIKDKIIAKQDEYIAYLTKAIKSESIIEAITAGVRSSYESELSRLKDEPAEQSDKLTAEIPADIVTKMQKEFEPNPDTSFRQGMYSGYAFGLQDGFKFAHSQFVGEKGADVNLTINRNNWKENIKTVK